MALIIDSFSDAVNDELYFFKILVLAFPVFLCADFYVAHNMFLFFVTLIPVIFLLMSLLSHGVYSISSNKQEILTLNPATLLATTIKMIFALGPYLLILSFIGFIVTNFVKIPQELGIDYLPLIFKLLVWYFLFSIFFTAFLAFSKNQEVKNAYNFQVISNASMDIFVQILFFIPQFVIFDGFLIGLSWYVCFFFKIPWTNPLFLYFCSLIIILTISMMSSYFAQVAYVSIKGKDEDYLDKYYIKRPAHMIRSKKDEIMWRDADD